MTVRSEQSRKIKPNRRSVTGWYPSRYGNLPFESALERDVYTLLDFEPSVKMVAAQPSVTDNYTADCKIDVDSSSSVCEVKYENELLDIWQQEYTKYLLADQTCRNKCIKFGFLTDSFAYGRRNRLGVLIEFRTLANHCKKSPIESKILEIPQPMEGRSVRSFLTSNSIEITPREIGCIGNLILGQKIYVLETPTADPCDAIVISSTRAPSLLDSVYTIEDMVKRLDSHPRKFFKED